MSKVVTFGEIMLRLSPPGFLRFSQANNFDVVYGGGESNVAVSLANYGIPVDFVTRLPKNDIGECALMELRKRGVNTQNIEDAASMQSSTDPNANTSTSTTGESNSETTNQNQVNPNMPNMSGLGGTGTGTSGTGAGSGNPGNGTGTGGTGTGLGGNNGDVGGRAVISNPKPPNRDGMQGTVKLSYKVDQNGTVSSIKIISENCYKCKAEAIETLKKWKYEKVSKAGYQTGTVTFIFEL